MDREELLARFDAEMRTDPPPEEGLVTQHAGPVVRQIGRRCVVIFSQLPAADAAARVAEETAFFRGLRRETEWKVYGHDRPTELAELLRAAGYVPDPPETLMVHDLEGPLAGGPGPPELEVRRVTDRRGLADAVAASALAFGPDDGWRTDDYAARLADPAMAILVGYLGGRPVSCARLEMPPGRSFAGLWGGGTAPAHRGRGIYRALVGARAEIARRRGFRYLSVEARATSRPTLERLGFEPLDSVTGWVLRP